MNVICVITFFFNYNHIITCGMFQTKSKITYLKFNVFM